MLDVKPAGRVNVARWKTLRVLSRGEAREIINLANVAGAATTRR